MKRISILKVAFLALPLMFSSCIFHKKKADTTQVTTNLNGKKTFIEQVRDNEQTSKFITSKVKFSVEVGPQKLTLTGNLKMKRDDVIRVQLMAFGFVEAGRIEFTKDYVLIMDRINKQYLKASYIQMDFLRNSGLHFSSLQALFWNELFKPHHIEGWKYDDDEKRDYTTIESGDDMIISYEEGKMDYSWLASKSNAFIRMANILYKDRFNGNLQLNWDYDEFKPLTKKMYPHKHTITLTTKDKEVKLGMTLNYVGADTEWETRTLVSNKYREVSIDEILRRFMSL